MMQLSCKRIITVCLAHRHSVYIVLRYVTNAA